MYFARPAACYKTGFPPKGGKPIMFRNGRRSGHPPPLTFWTELPFSYLLGNRRSLSARARWSPWAFTFRATFGLAGSARQPPGGGGPKGRGSRGETGEATQAAGVPRWGTVGLPTRQRGAPCCAGRWTGRSPPSFPPPSSSEIGSNAGGWRGGGEWSGRGRGRGRGA